MNEYVDFGRIEDDDREAELYGYFAPNGDYYLCLHRISDEFHKPQPDISFRISMSGTRLPSKTKKLMIELLKSLSNGNEINI